MGHYTNSKRYLRVCDVVGFTSDFVPNKCSGATSLADYAGVAQWYDLSTNISGLPNLAANLGTGTNQFDEFKIDKITYKVQVLNARQLSMDPDYRAPDGTGQNTAATPTQTMAKKYHYVQNCYVFHKRYQADNTTSSAFLNWEQVAFAQKGAATFVNMFRSKGKMFNTAITAQKQETLYVDGTANTVKKDGIPLGWQKYVATTMDLNVGQAGLIVPGAFTYGWGGSTNPVPQIRVTMRVCSTLRTNSNSIDTF